MGCMVAVPDADVVDLYVLAASLLVDEWRANRRTTQQTWEDLRSRGGRRPEERRLRHWRRVVAEGTMSAWGWLLRARRPAAEWTLWRVEAAAAARALIISRISMYVMNCWHELQLIRRRGIPSDTNRQERRFQRSIHQIEEGLLQLQLPSLPRPTATFGEQE